MLTAPKTANGALAGIQGGIPFVLAFCAGFAGSGEEFF